MLLVCRDKVKVKHWFFHRDTLSVFGTRVSQVRDENRRRLHSHPSHCRGGKIKLMEMDGWKKRKKSYSNGESKCGKQRSKFDFPLFETPHSHTFFASHTQKSSELFSSSFCASFAQTRHLHMLHHPLGFLFIVSVTSLRGAESSSLTGLV